VPFPAIVAGAGLIGFLAGRLAPRWFAAAPHGESGRPATRAPSTLIADEGELPAHARPSFARLARALVVGLLAWWAPLLLLIAWRGPADVLSQQAVFFSRAAMVTFGGAYAVLTYVNQAAVSQFGWLLPGQMLDGLGLAETTPGPLILVLEFVGFLAAWRHPGGLSPLVAAALGALVTVWATFAPCFLWIFAGAPYLERLRRDPRLAGALGAITAAVVGVIANLSLWFSIHAIFREVGHAELWGHAVPVPRLPSLDLVALGLAGVAFVGLRRWRWNVVLVVSGCAVAGLAARYLGWR
jgi:chromate transporter